MILRSLRFLSMLIGCAIALLIGVAVSPLLGILIGLGTFYVLVLGSEGTAIMTTTCVSFFVHFENICFILLFGFLYWFLFFLYIYLKLRWEVFHSGIKKTWVRAQETFLTKAGFIF